MLVSKESTLHFAYKSPTGETGWDYRFALCTLSICHIYEWKSVGNFHIKCCRSSVTFVTVDLLFDDFNFHITNFPFLSSNIQSSPAYGVFILQLIRYARACSSYECFIQRAARLSSKLLRQEYVIERLERLKSSLRKFYGRYGDLIKHYEVSLSQMLHDILGHDHIQWHPQLIRHYTNLRTYYRTGL